MIRGSFSFIVVAGFALTDVFKLATYAWEDDVSDLPLTYVFAYVGGSADETDTSSEMVVRAALESAIATDVYLPEVGIAAVTCFAGSHRSLLLSPFFKRCVAGLTVVNVKINNKLMLCHTLRLSRIEASCSELNHASATATSPL